MEPIKKQVKKPRSWISWKTTEIKILQTFIDTNGKKWKRMNWKVIQKLQGRTKHSISSKLYELRQKREKSELKAE